MRCPASPWQFVPMKRTVNRSSSVARAHSCRLGMRHTVAGVVRQADIVFTSIAKYVRQIIQEYKFPSARVVRLAIGSSLPQIRVTSERRARMARSLGLDRG